MTTASDRAFEANAVGGRHDSGLILQVRESIADAGSMSVARQAAIAVAAACALALTWLIVPIAYAPAGLLIGAAAFVVALAYPFAVCIAFVAVSMFRLHEAFPVLAPLQLPMVLAAVALASLAWNVCIGTLRIRSTPHIKLFGVFFLITTMSGVFAINPGTAFTYWASTYWKIGLMTVVIAWLPNRPRDLEFATRTVALCGLAVAAVAIRNKFEGLELVEGGRVTVGRAMGSVLGDPNDLAFILLASFGFSTALLITAANRSNVIIGAISAPAILLAIVFTQSRGGLIGLGVLSATLIFYTTRARSLIFLLAIVAGGVFAGTYLMEERLQDVAQASTTERVQVLALALKTAISRPLTGVGLDNFDLLNYFATGKMLGAHNTWMGVLVETGVPGAVVFIWMVAVALLSNVRIHRRLNATGGLDEIKVSSLAVMTGLAGVCAAGTFLTQGFTWPIYLLVALSAANAQVFAQFAPAGGIPTPARTQK